MEEFIKVDPKSFGYAATWWKEREIFWKDARAIWSNLFNERNQIKLAPKVDNKLLYEGFLDMAEKSVKEKWSSEKNKTAITQYIHKFLI